MNQPRTMTKFIRFFSNLGLFNKARQNVLNEKSSHVFDGLVKSFIRLHSRVSTIFENSDVLGVKAQSLKVSVDKTNINLEHFSEAEGRFQQSVDVLQNRFSSVAKLTDETHQNIKQMSSSLDGLNSSKTQLEELNTVIASISELAKRISGIAQEVKLLSFNASIEAARAGPQGAGFSVVAAEMNRMAGQSNTLSEDIQKLVSSNQKKVQETVKSISRNSQETSSFIEAAVTSFEELENEIEKSQTSIDVLKNAFEQQKSSSGAMLTILKDMTSELISSISLISKIKIDSEDLKTSTEKLDTEVTLVVCEFTGTKVENLSVREASKRLDEFTIVDVRGENEFNDELGHIHNAQLVTLNENISADLKNKGIDQSEKLLIVCRSGGRSSRACRFLQSAGFQTVFNLSGGMLEWNKEKLPVEKNSCLK